MTTKTLHGSCHCRKVTYAIEGHDLQVVTRCNCSICTKGGLLGGVLTKPAQLRLLTGEGETTVYEWGHKVSKRHFCKTCGVHLYAIGHLAELGGDFAAVNANTIDEVELTALPLKYWDGRHDNWHAGLRDTPWPVY